MGIRKKVEARAELWGSPALILWRIDRCPSTKILYTLLGKEVKVHGHNLETSPKDQSSLNRIACSADRRPEQYSMQQWINLRMIVRVIPAMCNVC